MKILLTTDGRFPAIHALHEATRLLAMKGADVLLVSVLDPEQHTGGNLDASHDVQDGLDILKKHGIDARAEVLRGEFVDCIITKARDWAADVVVVGADRSSKFMTFIGGSVSTDIVRKYNGAVLVVPSKVSSK
jgi:nucleotide-binding universal stress UspA family protein